MGKSGNDTMLFENFGFKAVMNLPMVQRKDGVCLVVREHEDTFYMLVNGCMVNLFSADPEKPNCDIISLEEGEFENGRWKAKRRLNGDEAASLLFNRYTLLKLKLFAYS